MEFAELTLTDIQPQSAIRRMIVFFEKKNILFLPSLIALIRKAND